MANRVLAANDALAAAVATALASGRHVRNPTGQSHLAAGDFVVSVADDVEPEVLRVLSGPVYDLKLVTIVTLARKAAEADRRDAPWADVDALRLALAADPTLGGEVEDARIDTVESAEMDRAKWMGGGLDVGVRLLFAAPSPAG